MPPSAVDFVEQWLPGPDGHQFYTRTYPATFPKAVILFVHGFAEHIARYEHAHVKYPARSITFFSFDLRGYGRTALDSGHRSKDSGYGKTSWALQMADIEHFGKYLAKEYPGVPLFLMGHSAGGGQTLAYFTRPTPPPTPEGLKLFTGTISSSPFITLTKPTPKVLRWTGGKLASLCPYMAFPATVDTNHISRNQAINEANMKDPLIKRYASLRILDDMVTGGEGLLADDYKRWPKDLPVLFCHGTGDKITSHKSTEAFYNKIQATDKKLNFYEGGYHELVNEIDGIPERLLDDCITWIEAHIPKKAPSPTGEPNAAAPSNGDTSAPESKL